MNIVAFCRVSTSIQDYERQSNELTTLANNKGWTLKATFAEKISGAKKNSISKPSSCKSQKSFGEKI